jgi:hypothetical protein
MEEKLLKLEAHQAQVALQKHGVALLGWKLPWSHRPGSHLLAFFPSKNLWIRHAMKLTLIFYYGNIAMYNGNFYLKKALKYEIVLALWL